MSDRQGASQSEQVPASPTESEPSSQPDALIDFQMGPHGLGLMGQRQQVRDHMDLIKTAVDASPTKVAVVGVKVTEGEKGFGKFDLKNSDSFDHVLIAYYDNNKQEYVVAEMMPGEGSDPEDPYSRLFGSESNPGTLQDSARMWDRFVAAPVALTPEQDAMLRDSVAKNMSGGNTYSFFSEEGNTCASGVRKVLVDAKVWDWTEQGFWAELEKVGLNIVQPGTVVEWAAQRSGVVYDSQIYARTPWPDSTDGGHDKLAQPAADGDTGASPSERPGPVSDTENARSNDAGSGQSGADHDQDASQEQTATASDSGNARIHDAAMPEAATAEIGVDPAVHDQAGPQVATSAPVIPDDGFSFSAFVKQENPAEVAKAAMPAEQLSPEDIPGSGVPAGESGLPDVGSEDVGNAAPTKEPVVHHGDLAP
jgi:hypothetical protein